MQDNPVTRNVHLKFNIGSQWESVGEISNKWKQKTSKFE